MMRDRQATYVAVLLWLFAITFGWENLSRLLDGNGGLGDVFWLLASDVFVPDFEFSPAAVNRFLASDKLAHLWLVPNPAHNPRGDFGLSPDGLALNLPLDGTAPRYTYSTIGLYRRELFDALPLGNPQGRAVALAPLLRLAMDQQQVSAELYEGAWTDVGTPARLAELNPPLTN